MYCEYRTSPALNYPNGMENPTENELSETIHRSLLDFTEDIYGQVVRFQREELTNVCLAPVCLYEVLAMLLSGSDGVTRIELQQVLHWPGQFPDSMVHHAVSSVILSCHLPFARNGLAKRMFLLKHALVKNQFLTNLFRHYKCAVEKVDTLHGAENKRRYINRWVTECTQHQITNLIPPKLITEASWSCMISALHCKTSEMKGATREGIFYLLDGSQCVVRMMHKVDKLPMLELPELQAFAMKMPLHQLNYQLLMILPYSNDGLSNLIQHLQQPGIFSTILAAEFRHEVLSVYVPQFTQGYRTHPDLNPILFGLGLTSLFDRTKSNLTGMVDDMELALSHIFHKAVLEIGDLGVTNQAVIASTRNQAIREFRADHPFFLCLLYDHHLPIVVGHVVKPRRYRGPVYVNGK
ncbi:unnamed protein product [Echinostoma caproni]|uniref:SERPIN domain-containing protein n=1 Tax=Echinostoma caproni TaxID=27848 RepID=A0A183AFH7_9TREM|nr:unnamed protein product [Echinostoma caproni]